MHRITLHQRHLVKQLFIRPVVCSRTGGAWNMKKKNYYSTDSKGDNWSGVSGDQFVKPDLSEVVFEIDSENFEAFVIEQSKKTPVLLSCYAEWCVPCQRLGKVLRSVATDSHGKFRLGTMDIDKNEELAIDLNVTSVPTVLLYSGGKLVSQFIGGRDRNGVEQFLSEHGIPFEKQE